MDRMGKDGTQKISGVQWNKRLMDAQEEGGFLVPSTEEEEDFWYYFFSRQKKVKKWLDILDDLQEVPGSADLLRRIHNRKLHN